MGRRHLWMKDLAKCPSSFFLGGEGSDAALVRKDTDFVLCDSLASVLPLHNLADLSIAARTGVPVILSQLAWEWAYWTSFILPGTYSADQSKTCERILIVLLTGKHASKGIDSQGGMLTPCIFEVNIFNVRILNFIKFSCFCYQIYCAAWCTERETAEIRL